MRRLKKIEIEHGQKYCNQKCAKRESAAIWKHHSDIMCETCKKSYVIDDGYMTEGDWQAYGSKGY